MEEIRLSKSGKATYILAVACLAFAGIGIQQIILSAGIYSWYHIPVLLGLSCMAAGPFILVELRITRSVSTRNGLLLMRTFGRKNRVGVSLGEALYYEVLPLHENFRESPRRFLVVSNHPFPSLRRGGAFTLYVACKAIDKSGKEIILPYEHPYVEQSLKKLLTHEVTWSQQDLIRLEGRKDAGGDVKGKIFLSKAQKRLWIGIAAIFPASLIYLAIALLLGGDRAVDGNFVKVVLLALFSSIVAAAGMRNGLRYVVEENGMLILYTPFRKRRAAISLNRSLYYEVYPLQELDASGREYVILANYQFLPFRERGIYDLQKAYKAADAAGNIVLLPYKHPYTARLLNRSDTDKA